MVNVQIPLHMDQIQAFCKRWNVTELALFGSVLQEDFRPESDVDVLVSFAPNGRWTFTDLEDMQNELREIFQRDIDLVERTAIERSPNYLRRRSIISSAQRIYAA
jgi:uncharacterized protein